MHLRSFALALLALASLDGAVHNDSSNIPESQDGRLGVIAKDNDTGLATVTLAVWAENCEAISAADLGSLNAYCKRGPGYTGRCAIALACTAQRAELIKSLAAQKNGRALAAWTLAAWALFERKDDDSLDEMRSGDGHPPRSAKPATFGTGAVGSAKGKGAADKHKKGKGDNGNTLSSLVPLMIELLADRDDETRSATAIAAAYAGINDAALIAALDAAADRQGPAAAASLLLHARLGQALDPARARAAFDDRRAQPKIISEDDAVLSLDPLTTPSAAMVCEAIGLSKDPALLAILHEGLVHKDLRVRYDAARAIRRLADPSSVPFLLEAIKHPKRSEWPVLVAVCYALADIPSISAIQPLIDVLKTQEKPATRFRQDILYALSSIAGNQFGRTTAASWETWLQSQEPAFVLDAAASADFRAKYRIQDMSVEELGGFYGMPIASDRIAFVLDYSNSMKGDKITNLVDNTSQTITDLAPHVQFNLVAFNSGVEPFDAYELSKDRKGALEFITNTNLQNQTRSYDGCEYSFALAEVDTLILLTDGQPTGGLVKNWNAIQPLTNLLLRYRPLAISCIDFRIGGKAPAGAKTKLDSLDQYANEHVGRYLIVE